MAITTLSTVKAVLGITDTSKDTLINLYIPLVEQQYLDIRNAPWDKDPDDPDTIVYPIGADITASEMIGYKLSTGKTGGKEVASESIDSYSVSFTTGSTTGGYPRTITSAIKKFINGA